MGSVTNSTRVRVALLGVPTDVNSSFRRGPAAAPARIREILTSDVGNPATESGAELGHEIELIDAGDVEIREDATDAERISARVSALVSPSGSAASSAAAERDETTLVPLVLGGDHSITYPVVRALAAIHGPLHILHIDAHCDLYDDFEGNPHSHASPFARIMEQGLASRLVQVGIRTLNRHQREQAQRFGVEIIPMLEFTSRMVPVLSGPLYVSVDLDGLDPAFAPGVSHQEPGGLSTRQLLDVLQAQQGPLVGADIVELNPMLDLQGITAALAAKLVKELASLAAREA
ncbi:MAG: agmatinase [Gemmatimonadetes bacterium]|nr:agmatinase [Gemmatimonadota bacterium]